MLRCRLLAPLHVDVRLPELQLGQKDGETYPREQAREQSSRATAHVSRRAEQFLLILAPSPLILAVQVVLL